MTKNTLNQSDCSILWSSVFLEGINWYLSFLPADNCQEKLGLRLIFWLVVADCPFLSNQIAGFLNYQYLRKESIDILVVYTWRQSLRECNFWGYHLWSIVHLVKSDCRILWSAISLKGINWCIGFLCIELIIERILDYHFWLGVARCASHPIRLHSSLNNNITGRNQSISLIFCMEIII